MPVASVERDESAFKARPAETTRSSVTCCLSYASHMQRTQLFLVIRVVRWSRPVVVIPFFKTHMGVERLHPVAPCTCARMGGTLSKLENGGASRVEQRQVGAPCLSAPCNGLPLECIERIPLLVDDSCPPERSYAAIRHTISMTNEPLIVLLVQLVEHSSGINI